MSECSNDVLISYTILFTGVLVRNWRLLGNRFRDNNRRLKRMRNRNLDLNLSLGIFIAGNIVQTIVGSSTYTFGRVA